MRSCFYFYLNLPELRRRKRREAEEEELVENVIKNQSLHNMYARREIGCLVHYIYSLALNDERSKMKKTNIVKTLKKWLMRRENDPNYVYLFYLYKSCFFTTFSNILGKNKVTLFILINLCFYINWRRSTFYKYWQ